MIDRRLLREARQVRLLLAFTIGLGLLTGFVTVLQAACLARVVNRVFLQAGSLKEVWPLLSIMLVLIFIRWLFSWGSEILSHRAAARIKDNLRTRLLQHLFGLGPFYVRGERTGELVNLVTEGVEALEDYFARYLPQLVFAVMIPLTVLFFVFPVDLTAGLTFFLTAPLIPLFMILIGKWAEHLTKRQWADLSRLSAHFLDVLQGLTTLKIFGRSKSQLNVIAGISENFRNSTMGVLRVAFLSALMLELLSTVSTALVAVALGLRLVYDRISFEHAFFLLLLAPEFYLPLRQLGGHFHAGRAGLAAAERIFEVLQNHVPPTGSKQDRQQINGQLHISFREVSACYSAGRCPALQEITFDLRQGERVALVGPSGAGKTTVANLLMRFIEPAAGLIKVNGIPLAQIPVDQWRSLISYLPQQPYLFYGTVADNILLGRPGASPEQVRKAAAMAGAHEFISQLPRGYDTPVGELGLRLSGGQAQRIALARAFLKDAPLLILDEAATGLDAVAEQVVQEAVAHLMKERTVLIIAHRLSTVYQADRILVLDRGRLVEQGRHQELLAKQGLYYQLLNAYRGEPV
ncbi:thiol reductant ABC exporter subunit CydD [Desulforamulus hydrothermalis]|uniref:ABC transporter, CydDC cysteine exporter (CydDC-E) family, permease/ATP-binding protein CydD n=1 Tax=Desulforamulus hydrothermalis Lam5 = DSM 18033 TaxID=1121428 RepID=K8DXF4_9FIRM|nr:thiol reductant ABC exporter subunit CydD [Desulforamulus hydrothermalis]CCO07254.1 ABC transporter, CydDC cysteine exporter (CydDC-E) family, permease/ATP-binding protein CydD [Desulforamulus hydrothermalis Lam5 = DSM 18033]SHG92388.1 ATP-binding cassette, subfamily C, CydD [Desulforamulus hydrothermalis Lam5 = DSM 18033]